MTDVGKSYIDFLEREFSGAPPMDDGKPAPPEPPTVERANWIGMRHALAPRSRIGPLFGVTKRDIDRAWRRLSTDPDLVVPRQRLTQRGIDVVVASFALILFSPLLALTALAIRVDSSGPVLSRQKRIGIGGREITTYHFRTLTVGGESFSVPAALADGVGADGVLFKMREDPRITRVGRYLRRYSLDEFPQLFNVLRGDMSLVGPRPALAAEAEYYDRVARRRLLVKPGLTGLWQVSGRADLSWEEAVQLDLYYVDNASLALDLAILARTIVTVFGARGAY